MIINDKLGINAELDKQMQYVVDTYQDEVSWRTSCSMRVHISPFALHILTYSCVISAAVFRAVGHCGERP